MKIIGLTGGIAMGKSTVAGFFKERGLQIHDADAFVHQLYDGIAVPWFQENFPHVVVNKSVSRETLSLHLRENPQDLKIIEAYIHPLIKEDRDNFIINAKNQGKKFIMIDMPLLFETKMQKQVDIIMTVSVPLKTQKERAMLRPNMTLQKLNFILERQWSDKDRRLNSHAIMNTNCSFEQTKRQVIDFLRAL